MAEAWESFARGMSATQDWRKNRQEEEMRDILIRGGKDAEGMHRLEMEELGLEPSAWGMKNPWIDKFFSFAKGRGSGRMSRPPKGEVTVSDLAAPEAPAYEGMGMGEGMGSGFGEDPLEYANGGQPRSALRGYADGTDREARLDAARERAAARGDKATGTETVKKPVKGAASNPVGGNVSTEGVGRVGGPGKTHMARRALDRAASSKAGKLGVAGALGATALSTARTPTEDYRERFGMELGPGEDATFMGDLGVRTLGAASDLGSVLTLGAADRFYRDKQRGAAGAPPAEPAAAPAPAPAAAPAAPAATGGGMSRTAIQKPSPSAAPEDMMDITKIQMSDVGPESIPDFRTRDWSEFREKALQGMVARGTPLAQAAEEVDNQTIRMQQKGFNHFAMQAAALMRAGNEKGAMAAIKAAYQMFPSGDDVKLGTINGQIVGITFDEETGKPTGKPMPITPETILALVDQANKPGAWNEYAKDQRDFALTVKKYLEMEKPQSEALSSAALTNASANMQSANARMHSALYGDDGGEGGMSEAEMRSRKRVFREHVELMGFTDPAEAERLASVMAQVQASNPGIDENTIVKAVMEQARGQGSK